MGNFQQSIDERVAVVTGAARGIGRAISRRLIADGHVVVVADVLGDLAQQTADEMGPAALAVETDVSDATSVASMVETVIGDFGRVDVLVNNAAALAGLARRPFEEIPEEEWDRVMAVNLKGPWLCVKAIAPHMKGRQRGKIINLSSDTALSGVPGLLHYVASKGGVVALTRSLASELGPFGIQVNAVAPGFTLTEAALEHGEEAARRSVERRAIPRAQHPEDLVGTISYLAGPDSDFVTGQLLVINGGYLYH